MVRGSCLCRQVRYQVEAFEGGAAYCHCSMCRKIHGSAFGVYARVMNGGFQWLEGRELVRSYQSSSNAHRIFCINCGSTLQMVYFDGDREIIDIALGTIDDDPGIRPTSHILVDSKAPWHEITDELAQRKGWT